MQRQCDTKTIIHFGLITLVMMFNARCDHERSRTVCVCELFSFSSFFICHFVSEKWEKCNQNVRPNVCSVRRTGGMHTFSSGTRVVSPFVVISYSAFYYLLSGARCSVLGDIHIQSAAACKNGND